MDAVAGHNVTAGLRNANDGAGALQFLAGNPEVAKTLDVDCGLAWLLGVVKPDFAASRLLAFVIHRGFHSNRKNSICIEVSLARASLHPLPAPCR